MIYVWAYQLVFHPLQVSKLFWPLCLHIRDGERNVSKWKTNLECWIFNGSKMCSFIWYLPCTKILQYPNEDQHTVFSWSWQHEKEKKKFVHESDSFNYRELFKKLCITPLSNGRKSFASSKTYEKVLDIFQHFVCIYIILYYMYACISHSKPTISACSSSLA